MKNVAVDGATSSDVVVDLYCLNCGYNLRGQSGDPRRCPECFHVNPVGDLEIPAAVITAQIRRMESAPAGCVGIVLILLPLIFGALLGGGAVYAIVAVVASLSWLLLVVRFRYYCMRKPGWLAALVKYHLCGLTLCTAALVAPVAAGMLIETQHPSLNDPTTFALLIIVVAALGLFVVLGAGRTHTRLRGILEPLQREVAVTLARDGLRRALRTGRKKRRFQTEGMV